MNPPQVENGRIIINLLTTDNVKAGEPASTIDLYVIIVAVDEVTLIMDF